MATKREIKEFSNNIEMMASNNNITLLDAIVEHCSKSNMEIDLAAKMISSSLKKKIKMEAMNRNLLKIKKPKGISLK